MPLDSLLIALQGFGFKLTPIAVAVQGLISQIQEEEEEQRYGGGGRRMRSAHIDRLLEFAELHPPAPRDELSVEEVLAKWDLLELQLAKQQRPAPAAPPAQSTASVPETPAPATPPARLHADHVAQLEAEQVHAMRTNEEALALILLLAEA